MILNGLLVGWFFYSLLHLDSPVGIQRHGPWVSRDDCERAREAVVNVIESRIPRREASPKVGYCFYANKQ